MRATVSMRAQLYFSDMKADPHALPGNDQRNVEISENFWCFILNLGMHIILVHAVFWKFAYPRFTGNADFAGFPT